MAMKGILTNRRTLKLIQLVHDPVHGKGVYHVCNEEVGQCLGSDSQYHREGQCRKRHFQDAQKSHRHQQSLHITHSKHAHGKNDDEHEHEGYGRGQARL